ncbi:MAG: hypothetical protein DRN08_06180 [Thermoplasmata archaeon]|nr:MAG: hypothetical protein DRN08_06180 [Thermoplasmata archaeon]
MLGSSHQNVQHWYRYHYDAENGRQTVHVARVWSPVQTRVMVSRIDSAAFSVWAFSRDRPYVTFVHRPGVPGTTQDLVIVPTAMLDTITSALDTVEIFMGGIAAISLLVAGIGIMNIMIVSLMERTREIGILKALGMKGRTVLGIFLAEALTIGVLGGVMGIGFGYVVSIFVSRIISGPTDGGTSIGIRRALFSESYVITPVLTPSVALMALFFGIVVSLVFGAYPAWKASRLQPVDALRYE